MRLFGTSGIRRSVDTDLVTLALQVGLAIGATCKNVVVGRDTRTSGMVLRHAVISGMLASGCRCMDAGIAPTPTVALAARGFEAGMMLTASHNPPKYNGIKLLNPDGSAFSAEQQENVEELVSGGVNVHWDAMRAEEVYSAALEEHISRIKQDFPGGIKLKVVVDAGCGAAYDITPRLLTQLGCEVIPLNCYPNGIFPHDVEPLETNLGDLMRAVKESGAALGIAHDGDADRMMAVDDLGRFIPGDKLLVILAQSCGAQEIVTTVDASMSIEEYGFNVRRTPVGDPYVSEVLKTWGGFGGEPSGAWVFPNVSLCPDGIYAAAKIAAAASQNRLSELVNKIPAYPVIRGNLTLAKMDLEVLKNGLLSDLAPVAIDDMDGVKLSFKDGWLLVRPSGTEPKLRITVEARDEQASRELYNSAVNIIRKYVEAKD